MRGINEETTGKGSNDRDKKKRRHRVSGKKVTRHCGRKLVIQQSVAVDWKRKKYNRTEKENKLVKGLEESKLWMWYGFATCRFNLRLKSRKMLLDDLKSGPFGSCPLLSQWKVQCLLCFSPKADMPQIFHKIQLSYTEFSVIYITIYYTNITT